MDEEVLYGLLGIFMFYVWIHFFVIQFPKNWGNRSGYEKFLTVAAIVFFALYIFGTAIE
tara:strand:- start:168 stop:344 length:177 start_codon:yes stop_codon:yes gene_type:complete